MRPAEEMDQADAELRVTIKKLWPLQAKKYIDVIVPPDIELGRDRVTVGKIYAMYLVLENWRTTRFGQIQPIGLSKPSLFARLMGIAAPAVAPHKNADSGGPSRTSISHSIDDGSFYNEGYFTRNRRTSRSTNRDCSNIGLELAEVVQAASRRESLASDEGRLRPDEFGVRGRSRSPSPIRGFRSPTPQHRRLQASPPDPRSHSPRRSVCYDVGFSDAVSDVVDMVKHETSRRGRARAKLRGDEFVLSPIRSRSPSYHPEFIPPRHNWTAKDVNSGSNSNSPERNYRSTRLNARSRSPSPQGASLNATAARRARLLYYYGTASLDRRSRTPSPQRRPGSSYPTIPQRRGGGRRLPPTPNKPSTLHLGPLPPIRHTLPPTKSPTRQQTINFPKLNASPTHVSKMDMSTGFRERRTPPMTEACARNRLPATGKILPMGGPRRPPLAPIRDQYPYERRPEEPLSFEQAVAIGRGSRQLPSPAVPNGYKPGRDRVMPRPGLGPPPGTSGALGHSRLGPGVRQSDSDEDDWC